MQVPLFKLTVKSNQLLEQVIVYQHDRLPFIVQRVSSQHSLSHKELALLQTRIRASLEQCLQGQQVSASLKEKIKQILQSKEQVVIKTTKDTGPTAKDPALPKSKNKSSAKTNRKDQFIARLQEKSLKAYQLCSKLNQPALKKAILQIVKQVSTFSVKGSQSVGVSQQREKPCEKAAEAERKLSQFSQIPQYKFSNLKQTNINSLDINIKKERPVLDSSKSTHKHDFTPARNLDQNKWHSITLAGLQRSKRDSLPKPGVSCQLQLRSKYGQSLDLTDFSGQYVSSNSSKERRVR